MTLEFRRMGPETGARLDAARNLCTTAYVRIRVRETDKLLNMGNSQNWCSGHDIREFGRPR